MFKLHGKLTTQQTLVLGILGLVIFLVCWFLLAEAFSEQKAVVSATDSTKISYEKVYPLLPRPDRVVKSYQELSQKDGLWSNTSRSIWLNLKGYFWAVILAIPLGAIIALIPLLRGLFSKHVDALRYLPLTALTGLFIIWFGIEDQMKIAFLAFGVLVYLLPIVVQRIDETEDVYLKTAYTLGASNWQIIKSVYMPSVFSKLIDDIRVLTAISWTYIIIAELLNREGGIGALIYIKARQGQIDKVFAILIVIILIGFLQDRLFAYLDKRFFPNKYYKTTVAGNEEVRYGVWIILGTFTLKVLQEIFLPHISESINSFIWIVVLASVGVVLYGEFRLRTQAKSAAN
ncbi:ABC transporter permease [Emticicia sp. BO119]|uniref:ABC transporter permease n=1 Tax=Emticicia sp. BO119 TaxID=2757768 RepID=UPI0015F0E190|nr:ABC transporter permease subunit [Emticicia sp. BO119]MBA4851203.1 ABC transporter permease subunit [Emticicia sp. BO119]